ncbi:RHS repeat domain-containing protein, partial [Flavobacterium psychrophilum]
EGFVGNGLPEKDVFYYHPDHLGSSSYISTLNGQISQHVEYIAFGEVLFEEHSSSFKSPYLFNGKELDRETNLTNFGARYLDMKTSLWLNVDPLAERGPEYSPYCYTFNNPMRFNDPDGRWPFPIGPISPINIIGIYNKFTQIFSTPKGQKTAIERAYNPKTYNTDVGKLVMAKIDDVIKNTNTYKKAKTEVSDKEITTTATSQNGGGEGDKSKGKKTGDNMDMTGVVESATGQAPNFNDAKSLFEVAKTGLDLFDLGGKIGDGANEVVKENQGQKGNPSDMVQTVNDPKNPNNNQSVRRDVLEAQQKKKE